MYSLQYNYVTLSSCEKFLKNYNSRICIFHIILHYEHHPYKHNLGDR